MLRTFLNGTVLLIAAASGGGPLSAQTFADADSLLARADTNGAIAVYEAMLKRDIRNAEAHYRAGVLHMSRHVPGEEVSAPRRKAEEHFRYATRFEGDSAKYWLALAELFRGEDITTTRVQVARLVGEAHEAAQRSGSPTQIALVGYRAARVEWERYEQYGRRFLFNDPGDWVDDTQFMRDWRYVEDLLERRVRPDPGRPGLEPLSIAEARLREALSADAAHVPSAGLMIVALTEHGRWAEALPLARRLARVARQSGPAWAVLGLAYARAERWVEAEAAFDTALARMTPAERAPYENIGLLLRRAEQLAWDQAGRADRESLDSLYWDVADPLLLAEGNESRTEFFARLTYALHRWSDPLRGYTGIESDLGAVYVRYGPPDVWMALARGALGERERLDTFRISFRDSRRMIFWIYPRHRLRFVFGLAPGYARTYFAGGYSREQFRETVTQQPVLFDNVPLVRNMDTVAVQVAQFRGVDTAATDVGVFSFIPVGRMVSETQVAEVSLTAGAIVRRNDGVEVDRLRREDVVETTAGEQVEHRSWRMALAPDLYNLRVEAFMPQLNRGARSTESLEVRRFGTGALELSDVLLARRVEPRDSTYARWTDFLIEPSAGRYQPGEPMGLLWEIYGLERDSTGVARYAVSLRITVTQIERRSLFAEIIGGVGDAMGVTAEGDDQVELVYDRDASATGDIQVEHLAIDLRDAPEGRYTLTVTVHDRIANRSRSGTRTFHLSRAPLTPSVRTFQR